MRNLPLALILAFAPAALQAAEADWSRTPDTNAILLAAAASKEAAAAAKTPAAPSAKMKPETEAFLRSIDIDPGSKDVVDTYAEGSVWTSFEGEPDEYSLDIFASKKRKAETIAFIKTRTLIRNLKKDYEGTALEKYDSGFLTSEERKLMGRKIVDEIMKRKKS